MLLTFSTLRTIEYYRIIGGRIGGVIEILQSNPPIENGVWGTKMVGPDIELETWISSHGS